MTSDYSCQRSTTKSQEEFEILFIGISQ